MFCVEIGVFPACEERRSTVDEGLRKDTGQDKEKDNELDDWIGSRKEGTFW